MNLTLNESVMMIEGEMREICVTVSSNSHERERDINVSFSVLPNSNTSGNVDIIT